MSASATMARIRSGRVEYLECGNAYDVVDSVISGPAAIGDYIDGRNGWSRKDVVSWRTLINSAEDEGCLVVDYDEKVILFFGGDIDCSYQRWRSTMERIASASCWDGWDVRWAYEGLLDAARYLGQVPELFDDSSFGEVDMLGARLSESGVKSDAREAASVIAVNSGDKLDLYPLSTMFPEDLLHYGEANRVSMLSKQGHRSVSHLEGIDLVRGFLFDEDAMVVTYWGLCCELLPGHLERAWPGCKAIDLGVIEKRSSG